MHLLLADVALHITLLQVDHICHNSGLIPTAISSISISPKLLLYTEAILKQTALTQSLLTATQHGKPSQLRKRKERLDYKPGPNIQSMDHQSHPGPFKSAQTPSHQSCP
ncbi:hypothetical protein PHYBLDRAFT_146885 [Phycomyces blakesleeanus NRRL 1555(-)]|uniref:Homeodomain-like DNA binding domain-containing transcription factor n=1 Tax=Phycomyces blakesleeanus (strain ATCC 8743b / DSM 1359 / FGSC 10004 / NBRC 33097 / NRRL 1555) TaxID=763407 RepID=A0A162PQ92_PHYB8|nr:hypothetical protein PHYBLDRAFT_146885 [Phycomyces blakesleeanus NRRL 1555(-)]OAD71906.1 hypothetical protein PHYBLDRAFT_146885 [Phycomyces blakesleeanus NRRL 1555(-)]|eukprot:XP_018289946.1 hypothetical protein PHYBLDRAFT_146885 [Phycomyces blakesleeanus NRRL 1555(-)]